MKRQRIISIFMSFILAVSLLFTFDLEVKAISQSDVVSELNSYIAQYNGKRQIPIKCIWGHSVRDLQTGFF